MKWLDFISGMYAQRKLSVGMECKAVFQPPASIQDLADLEAQLNTTVPGELRSLLLETNGVMSLMKIDEGDWFEDMSLLWPTHRIILDNLIIRRESAEGAYEGPFQELLIFANAGSDGILFAHPIDSAGLTAPSVMAWVPIPDELTQIAPTLRDFIGGWLMSRITF